MRTLDGKLRKNGLSATLQLFLPVAMVLVGLLAACGTTQAPTPTSTQTAEVVPIPTQVVSAAPAVAPVAVPAETAPVATSPTVKKEEPLLGGVWDYISGGPPTIHDPYFIQHQWTLMHVFNSLFQIKLPMDPAKGAQFEPYLATDYSSSEDRTKWRVKLRQGVTFHDGEAFNADDVVATMRRVLDPDFLSYSEQRNMRAVFAGVKKIDDYTVEFDTGKPDSTAVSYFQSYFFLQMPEHLIRGDDPTSSNVDKRWKRMGVRPGDSGTFAIGTGPFKVKDWNPDTVMNLVKNPNYFKFDEEGRRLPYMDGIRYHNIQDPIRRLATFVAGKAEYFPALSERDAKALCKQTKDPGCYLHKWPHGNGYMMTNPKSTPLFQDPKVSTAFRYGFRPEKALYNSFAGGNAHMWVWRELWPDSTLSEKEQNELLPWSNPARDDEFTAKAKQLLAEGGYPNGVELPYPFYATVGTSGACSGSQLDASSRHMDEIYKLGFKTFLECRAGVVTVDELKAGRWSIQHYYTAIALVDRATGIISGGTRLSGIVANLPYPWEGVDQADAKYAAIRTTLDQAKQDELYKDYERYMADSKRPLFFTFYSNVFMTIRSCAHDYAPVGTYWVHVNSVERVWLTGECRDAG